MNLDVLFFLSYVAALLGQFSDARTTQVGLAKGFIEANTFAAKIIAKVGFTPVFAFKVGILPLLAGIVAAKGHEKFGIYLELFVAGIGFALGILNFLKLRKSGVTFTELFVP